ncbi:MAG: NAD-dependent epimerase/dehydratase family protein, partial [Halobacteriovoraceae bacterium]|nr:NAD-dependent epimerase/dehydratase family protein [Halobacteriovoraceae bacterium]
LAEKEAPEIRIIHLSSAGVIGNPKKQNFVNENTKPQPNNTYEKSKYEAEIIALSSPLSSSTVLVRPINVVDRTKPGVAASYLQKSFKNLLKTILFGNEFAHMIHAKTVAQAILFLESHADKPSGIFFVSNDHDSMNRFRYIWSEGKKTFLPIFPLFISGIIRKITGGHNNTGRICYSSSRLKSLGFKDFCNVNETLKLLDSSLPAEKTLSVL